MNKIIKTALVTTLATIPSISTLPISAITFEVSNTNNIDNHDVRFNLLYNDLKNLNSNYRGLKNVPTELIERFKNDYFKNISKTDFNVLWNNIAVKINQRSTGFLSWLRGTYYCAVAFLPINCGARGQYQLCQHH